MNNIKLCIFPIFFSGFGFIVYRSYRYNQNILNKKIKINDTFTNQDILNKKIGINDKFTNQDILNQQIGINDKFNNPNYNPFTPRPN